MNYRLTLVDLSDEISTWYVSDFRNVEKFVCAVKHGSLLTIIVIDYHYDDDTFSRMGMM